MKRVNGEWVRVVREDGSLGRVSLDRLLAKAGDQGRFFRFHGWRPLPRGYRAELVVVEIQADESLCVVRLPEWDQEVEIPQPLAILPEGLRVEGAAGSCMANLASASAAGLNIHSCRRLGAPLGSRSALGPHPVVLAKGQKFRRREDRALFRLLEGDGARPSAWNGSRTVRLSRDRLLAQLPDGRGRFFEYIGGGKTEARRRRAEKPMPPRAKATVAPYGRDDGA